MQQGNPQILWSKNHKYIMDINGSLDGHFYINVYEAGKHKREVTLSGSLAHGHKWAFREVVKMINNNEL